METEQWCALSARLLSMRLLESHVRPHLCVCTHHSGGDGDISVPRTTSPWSHPCVHRPGPENEHMAPSPCFPCTSCSPFLQPPHPIPHTSHLPPSPDTLPSCPCSPSTLPSSPPSRIPPRSHIPSSHLTILSIFTILLIFPSALPHPLHPHRPPQPSVFSILTIYPSSLPFPQILIWTSSALLRSCASPEEPTPCDQSVWGVSS